MSDVLKPMFDWNDLRGPRFGTIYVVSPRKGVYTVEWEDLFDDVLISLDSFDTWEAAARRARAECRKRGYTTFTTKRLRECPVKHLEPQDTKETNTQ